MTAPSPFTLAYLTDVEGRWDKLEGFTRDNPLVRLDAHGALHVAPGATFIFGGDAIDRGPQGRRVVEALLSVKKRQPGQVVLLAGNRDINKLRLLRELNGHPPQKTPDELRAAPRPVLLKWIFQNTMGAGQAFEMRRQELGTTEDDAVVESFLKDLAPDGVLAEYLAHCQLIHRAGSTLFVHGAVTDESLGAVPGSDQRLGVDAWVDALNAWYDGQLLAYREQRFSREGDPMWTGVVAYQAPVRGTRMNQASVVYGRLTDEDGNPHLPREDVVASLGDAGIRRVVVGHTPSGDSPSILRDSDGFELIMADNSYGRVEDGTRLLLADESVSVASRVELDDGQRLGVAFTRARDDGADPIGHRLADSGHLIKGGLDDGAVLLFKGLPGFKVEQRSVTAGDIAGRRLVVPR